MTITTSPPSSAARFRPVSLDAVNFLLADVRGALGPYLNVFLVTQQGWSQSSVGLMTTIGGLIGLAAQTPAGAAIDATRAKRSAIVLALGVLAFGATVIFAAPSFWPVLAANTVLAVVGDIFGPAVTRESDGTKRGVRSCRKRGHRSHCWGHWLAFWPARRFPPCSAFCRARCGCRDVDPSCRHRPQSRTRSRRGWRRP